MTRRLLAICLTMASIAAQAAATEQVTCPSEPPVVRRLQLQERWRVDVDHPEAPVWGYTYESQVLSHDGRFYFLDAQLCNIHVFDRDGAYLGKILGEGQGPGEVSNPGAMFLCRDGRIAVQHGYPSKLEFVDLAGNPKGRWQLHANAYATRLQETARGWFGVYTESKQADDPNVSKTVLWVALHDDDGARTRVFHTAAHERNRAGAWTVDEEKDFVPWYTAIAVGDGGVLCASARNEYRLEWRNPDGELTRVATRKFGAHRRTAAEINTIRYRSYSISNNTLTFPDQKLSDFEPVISSMKEMADGSIRVRTSFYQKDLPAGMVCRYEVHEPTGELRERVEIYDPTGEFDADYDVIALLADDCAVVLRNVRPASRSATDARLHPDLLKKLPPIPDDREDIVFTPVVCDLVPYAERAGTAKRPRD